jgi:hypothetical protein
MSDTPPPQESVPDPVRKQRKDLLDGDSGLWADPLDTRDREATRRSRDHEDYERPPHY